MSQQPDFIEFAAIQIFAAMVGKSDIGRIDIGDARHVWQLARMLFDAKPEVKDQGIKPQMDVIRKRMQEESDLAWGWHCNVAMAFIDEGGDRESANRAAARFMKAAFGVDTSQSEEWKKTIEPYIQPKRNFHAVVDQEGNHAIYEEDNFVLELVSGEFFEDEICDAIKRKLKIGANTSVKICFTHIDEDVVMEWPKSLAEALKLNE